MRCNMLIYKILGDLRSRVPLLFVAVFAGFGSRPSVSGRPHSSFPRRRSAHAGGLRQWEGAGGIGVIGARRVIGVIEIEDYLAVRGRVVSRNRAAP